MLLLPWLYLFNVQKNWQFVITNAWKRIKFMIKTEEEDAEKLKCLDKDREHYIWLMVSAVTQAMTDFIIDSCILITSFASKGYLSQIKLCRFVFLSMTISAGVNSYSGLHAIMGVTEDDAVVFQYWETMCGAIMELMIIVSDIVLLSVEVHYSHGWELIVHVAIRSWFLLWTGLNFAGFIFIMIRDRFFPFEDFFLEVWWRTETSDDQKTTKNFVHDPSCQQSDIMLESVIRVVAARKTMRERTKRRASFVVPLSQESREIVSPASQVSSKPRKYGNFDDISCKSKEEESAKGAERSDHKENWLDREESASKNGHHKDEACCQSSCQGDGCNGSVMIV